MKKYIVTAAILTNKNQILCMQRNKSKFDYITYKYEFPGGKVEKDESLETGLARELREEMDILVEVKPSHFYMTVEHQYPDFKITMHSYLIPIEKRDFLMKEHINAKWLNPKSLLELDWAAADEPIVESLMREL